MEKMSEVKQSYIFIKGKSGIVMNQFQALKHYFGYDSFRQGQDILIEHLLKGQDVVGIMPTGAGKSICFQIPALLFPGLTLVISPLISLMKDQVHSLIQAGVNAGCINGSMSWIEVQDMMQGCIAGHMKILYVAPERLLDPTFLSFVDKINISMIAVDEAHCVSQWGQDFRPSYLKIHQFLNLLEKRPIVGAFTATATKEVRTDMIEILELQNPKIVTTGFNRENLYFEVQRLKDKLSFVGAYIKRHSNESGIIYCNTRKNVDELCLRLQGMGVPVTKYHAGLSSEERRANQEDFLFDRKPIMIATNAFGMGIDKSNVAYVLHYNMPKNIESYYQEAGRAGRGGEPGECIILYQSQDVRTNQYFIDNTRENEALDTETLEEVKEKERERLKQMTFYCHTKDCLRSYILKYFGELGVTYCGNCSTCRDNFHKVDKTIEAQKILSCIRRAKENAQESRVIDCLCGEQTASIEEVEMHSLSTFGLLADYSREAVRTLIIQLLTQGYLERNAQDSNLLAVTEKGIGLLVERASFFVPVRKAEEKRVEKTIDEMKEDFELDTVLFERLKSVRSELAREQKVPAFVIFSDASLREMCTRLPVSEVDFRMISGVGRMKLERYGKMFMSTIQRYIASNK